MPTLRAKPKVFVQVSEEQLKQFADDEAFLKSIDEGNAEVVLASGRKGSDLNVADEFRTSASHKAMRNNPDGSILKYLIDNDAYLEFPDRDGIRPISHAIRFDNVAAVKTLLALKKEDGSKVVDVLHIVEKTKQSLLHEAAWFDRPECAKLLLETGLMDREFVNLANGTGQTAMHLASFRSTPEFIQLLVEFGADSDAVTVNPRQPKKKAMDIANVMGKPANAKFLQDLSVAIASIRFASRMKKRKNANKPKVVPKEEPTEAPKAEAAKAEAKPDPTAVLHMRFDFDFKLFTADLEKAFIVQLAKHAGVEAEQVYVLSRTAGSVVLELEFRAPNAAEAMGKVERSSLEDLTTALGYPILSRSVGPLAKVGTPRSTPGFKPVEAVGQSPRSAKVGPE